MDITRLLIDMQERRTEAKVVELHFFGGLTVEETAHALGIAASTVKRDWSVARAFLLGSLQAGA